MIGRLVAPTFGVPHVAAKATEETFEMEATKEMVSRMTRVVESKHELADLQKVVAP